MSNFWTVRSGTQLTILQERVTLTYPLPIASEYLPLSESDMTITLVSGQLPRGLRLDGSNIVGTPYEVSQDTLSTFVLRAEQYGQVDERTYKIVVQGSDDPVWQTPEDLLAVGNNNTYFIIDSSPLDFQLLATDNDLPTGETLEYYINPGKGELPPGIQLTTDGRLVGVVEPILALEKTANKGQYDDNTYGTYPFDFGVRSGNGFASFYYDSGKYDISVPTRSPKKLNRFYEFTVTVSDGQTTVDRTFRIYVVGDDFLRSDNTIMQVANGIFTADVTNIRVPIWITPSDFGFRRANNYLTLFLDVIDPNSINGILSYTLEARNPDGTPSNIPPGTVLDENSGEIAGRVPYQPAVTREYKFTVNAVRTVPDSDVVDLTSYAFNEAPQGSGNIDINKLTNYYDQLPGRTFQYFGVAYEILSVDITNPDFDRLQLNRALTVGVPQGTDLDFGKYTISGVEQASKAKTFTVKMLGEIDSVLTWDTNSDLGSISSNYISTLQISATSTVPNANLLFTKTDGNLPPGLRLSYDGQIIGKINSFGTAENPGLTVFDSQDMIFDNNTTSIDREYTFTAQVQDNFGYSAITREFTIKVADPDDKLYSNLVMRPFFTQENREVFETIVSDNNIFPNEYIYRPNDPNFGIQKSMQMLVYSGIETKQAQEYISAVAKNTKRKKYRLGEIKSAIAKTPGTNDIVYEVIYVQVIDPSEAIKGKTNKKFNIKNKKELTVDTARYELDPESVEYNADPSTITIVTRKRTVTYKLFPKLSVIARTGELEIGGLYEYAIGVRDGIDVTRSIRRGSKEPFRIRPNPENNIKIDSNAITIDGSNDRTRYISNIQNLRDNIRALGETEINFLPLWMRTAQPGEISTLGYTKAVPLCYCKPGTSKEILTAIKNNNIDFSIFNFDIDRLIIDSTQGNSEEQYILFANYRFNA